MNNLKNLGYSTWFETRTDQDKLANHKIARVVSVHKDSYLISKGGSNIFSELSGNLLYTANLATDLPTTGDWVYANFYDDESHGIIYGILPRKSLLRRKAIGKLVDVQLIAANIVNAITDITI